MSESAPVSDAPPRPAHRMEGWVGGLCVLGVLALTFLLVPGYWWERGFPLDDSWIHAVYARSMAQGQWLSYNPGVPATGETSPLWAVVLALAHLGHPDVARMVLNTKLLGFLLHGLTAAGWYLALRDSGRRLAACAALLVLVSPYLVAASLSGMEVPLATLAVVAFVLALRSPQPALYVLCGALGPLARPEVGMLLFLLPLVVRPEPGWRPVARRWSQAALGVLIGGGAWASWNVHASGLPLPATFYAKVHGTRTPLYEALLVGFGGSLPLTSWPLPVLILLALGTLVIVWRYRSATGPERLAAGFTLCAAVFCATSALLLRSPRADSFYAQRYVLPAAPFLMVALPLMIGGRWEARVERRSPRLANLLVAVLPLVLLLDMSPRLERLENDAHNIDDLQIQEGLFLAHASPSDTVWVLDAGATRFFGNAFVVDTLGLNTPQMLREDAQAYLDAHPPRWIEWTEGWNYLKPDKQAHIHEAKSFKTSTLYTTTPRSTMSRRVLLECTPGSKGDILIGPRWRKYQCETGSRTLPDEPTPTPSTPEQTQGP